MRLQALYTVGELAKISGLSPQRIRRFLWRKGIVKRNEGARGDTIEVLLVDLVDKAPGFWRTLERRINGEDPPVLENEAPTRDERIIYFMQREDDPGSPVKIGTTSRLGLRARLSTIQTSSPYKVRLLATMPGDGAAEARLHADFAAARLCGEWFEPTDALMSVVAQAIASERAKP